MGKHIPATPGYVFATLRRLHGRLIKDPRRRRDLLALADLRREREDGGAAGEGALFPARIAEGREALALEHLCADQPVTSCHRAGVASMALIYARRATVFTHV